MQSSLKILQWKNYGTLNLLMPGGNKMLHILNLFPEGTRTVCSEVFQAPICTTQPIRNLHSAETTIGIWQRNLEI